MTVMDEVTIGQMQERLAKAMGCPLDETYPRCSHGADAWEYASHLIRDGYAIVAFDARDTEEAPDEA